MMASPPVAWARAGVSPVVAKYGQFTVNLQAIFRISLTKSELPCRHDRTTTTNQGFSRLGKLVMPITRFRREETPTLIRFLADRCGGVAPILGLGLVPLLGAVGAAVDYSRAGAIRTAMQRPRSTRRR